MITVEQERALLLRALVPPAAMPEMPKRTHGILLRAVLFVLTALGLGALYLFLDEVKIPGPGIVAGLFALALAEYLIHARRWWWTGVEEALWLGAMIAFVSELPNSGRPEAMLVLALACGVPAFRVRNPLSGAAAAVFVMQWFEKRFDLGVVAALVLAAIAVLALLRMWRRPSTEWLWVAIALVLPLAGRFEADPVWRTTTIVLYAVFGAVVLALALRKRHHALFLSGGIALGIAAVDLAERLRGPLEAKLAAGGAVLLAGAWIVARVLRERTAGLVVTPAELTPFDEELQIAATVALPQQQFDSKMESGGEFGGAGATGQY